MVGSGGGIFALPQQSKAMKTKIKYLMLSTIVVLAVTGCEQATQKPAPPAATNAMPSQPAPKTETPANPSEGSNMNTNSPAPQSPTTENPAPENPTK